MAPAARRAGEATILAVHTGRDDNDVAPELRAAT
jgi:hypothetical protein